MSVRAISHEGGTCRPAASRHRGCCAPLLFFSRYLTQGSHTLSSGVQVRRVLSPLSVCVLSSMGRHMPSSSIPEQRVLCPFVVFLHYLPQRSHRPSSGIVPQRVLCPFVSLFMLFPTGTHMQSSVVTARRVLCPFDSFVHAISHGGGTGRPGHSGTEGAVLICRCVRYLPWGRHRPSSAIPAWRLLCPFVGVLAISHRGGTGRPAASRHGGCCATLSFFS